MPSLLHLADFLVKIGGAYQSSLPTLLEQAVVLGADLPNLCYQRQSLP